MSDHGPTFRLWPPVSVGVPLLAGLGVSWLVGDPLRRGALTSAVGWLLIVGFAVWNGWALWLMARHRTGLLPGAATSTILDRGPFGRSRNPLYVGLLVCSAGIALLAGSLWALAALPVEWALLGWGAIVPEERYLSQKFGPVYASYQARVRRWL